MNYEQFMECVRTRVEEVLGGEARVTVYSVVKNNSVKLDAVSYTHLDVYKRQV